jgi:FkbM family methyltransferase
MKGAIDYQIKRMVKHRLRPKTNGHWWFQVQDLKLLLDWPSGLATNLHFKNTYHPQTVNYLRTILKESDICVDVGAHAGYITAIMAKRCYHVVAFEPNPEMRQILKANLRANNIHNVTVRHEAVSDSNGKARFFTNIESMYSGLVGHDGLKDVIEVDTVTLDSVLNTASLIKIDVEGVESRVVKGMKRIMQRNPDLRIIVEIEPDRKGFSEEIYDLLEGWSFQNLDRLNVLCWREGND